MTFADLFRRIQYLANKKKLTKEEEQEFNFYNGLVEVFQEIFVPGVGTLVEIPLWGCPVDQANKFAQKIGLFVVEGSSGTVYLNWPDSVDMDAY